MSTTNKTFTPAWYEETAPQGSYRSIFKWGNLNEFKHPNRGLYELMKHTFNMTDEDFRQPRQMGLESVEFEAPVRLKTSQVNKLREIVGNENVRMDSYARLRATYGKGTIDLIRLRNQVVENIPDIVLCPRDSVDIEKIVTYCNDQKTPLYVYGGGTSVTRGFEAVKGGVTLDMGVYMNKVVDFNEIDRTVTVQAGMMGPELEKLLNNAPEYFGSQRSYTCGHFPQSFEYSSVGGWVVTRGAGQNSTYYGKIEDIVLAQEYVTPIGTIKIPAYPRTATGPDLNQLMMGSEGDFGVLVNVTLKMFHYTPQNRKYFSYMFHDWEAARNAVREIMLGEFGFPSVFRLSDPEETDIAMRLYGVEGTVADSLLSGLGYQAKKACLLLGCTDGELGFCINLKNKVSRICKRHGAFSLTLFKVAQAWERGRFQDPYLREDLLDYGIMIDTLECAVTWSQMEKVHAWARAYIKNCPHTICMAHLSHAYPQGGNLYFIFIAKLANVQEYLELQYGVLDAIQKNGAAMSHHHGLGKQTTPWFVEQVERGHIDVLRSLKRHFDPNNIMNPGGTLGLDMSPEQREKRWRK